MVLGIYGASGLGTEFESLARRINEDFDRWEDIVFVDDAPEKNGQILVNRKIINFEQAMEAYGKDGIEFILGIGEPAVKDIVFKKLCDAGCEVTCLIHPEVRIFNETSYGKGVVVQRHSGFPPRSKFGNNVLLQGTTVMGHDIVLGDNVVISSFAFVGGDTVIGKNTYVGPHSCIRNGLKIGENVVIGMGSVVTKDVPDNAVVYGNPAKVMRYNENGRVFSK